ncbi:MAG: hypothetical protein COV75_04380 [Candidatus Omnitrophica bacterium CG11_big_fil_rev_8_21_14_0_20_63_9]|nr:MAG: hypothetical protein COV75_04380 [Candidatus Omnitrophica bacterium CG11_big_fil_rev_8_21_14_0_20_63_9]
MKSLQPAVWRGTLRYGLLAILTMGAAGPSLAARTSESANTAAGVAEILFEEGKRRYDRGNYEDAEHEFRKLLLIQPAHQGARDYLALIHRSRQQRAEAIEASLDSLVEVQPAAPRTGDAEPSQAAPTPSARPPVSTVPDKAAEKRMSAMEAAMAAALGRIEAAESAERSIVETPATTEEAPRIPVAAARVARVGQIGLFIDDVEVPLQRPIQVVDGEPRIPLRDLAAARYVSLIELGQGQYQLVFPNGEIKSIALSTPGDEPMLTEQEVGDFFGVETLFDPGRQAFVVRTITSGDFRTYVVEKSAEELQEEAAQEALAQRASAPAEFSGEIPEAARPDIDLTGRVSYGYRDPHLRPSDRTLIYGVTGRAYDFDVRGESSRKDRGGIFDHDYTYLNLSKPDLFIGLFDQSTNLYPLRGQSESVTGLKLRKAWDQGLATSFLGGMTETVVPGTTRQVKYLGHLFQVGQEMQPADWARLNTSVLLLENEVDLPELVATSTLPRQNLVSFADLTLDFPYDLGLSTSLARADYAPDNDSKARKGDWDVRVNPFWETERSSLGVTYELVGDRYASVENPVNYNDFEGWNLYANHQFNDRLSASAYGFLYGNNVDDEPHRITQDNQALSLSTNYRLPWEHTVALSFSDFLSDPSGPDPGSSNRTRLYRTDYAMPFAWDTRLLLNYNHLRTHQPSASDSYSHAFGGSIFKGFGWGSSIYLSELLTRSVFEDSPDNWNSTTSFNVNYEIKPNLSVYWNTSYTRNATEEAVGADTLAGATGMRWQMSPERALTAEYSVGSYDIDRERGRSPSDWSVFVLLSQSFGFRSQPAFGSIAGRVVQDANGNGRAEPGEPGVIEAVVLLDTSGRQAVTTEAGYFSFSRVVPGPHTVTLDPASLPETWTVRESAQRVSVGRNKRLAMTFVIQEAGAVSARVFLDGNGDGQFQDTEEPLEGIAVVLQPGEQFRRSSDDGLAEFEQVMPGRYVVQLYEEDLPVGYALTSERERAIEVEPGATIGEIPFAVQLLTTP